MLIGRKNDEAIFQIVNQINDLESEICLVSERVFLKELKASCSTPVAVYACKENDSLNLKTMILDYDGSDIFETSQTGEFNLQAGQELARQAALKTKKEAAELLKKICS